MLNILEQLKSESQAMLYAYMVLSSRRVVGINIERF